MAEWTPSNLAAGTLSAWYKADSISGSDGDAIASWSDSSGNGNTASQAVTARKPTLQTAELNGSSVIRFDGTNDIVSDGDIAALDVGTGDIWMACVFKSTDDSGVQDYFEKGHQSFGLSCLANGKLQICLGSTANAPKQNAGNWSRTEFVLVTGSRVSNTNSGFVNGTATDTTGTTDNGSISNSNTFDIGSRAIGAGPMTGDIAEILVGGATLSVSDRQTLEGYLAHKYGLTGNLPNKHPYKNIGPTTGFPGANFSSGQTFSPLSFDLNGELSSDLSTVKNSYRTGRK